MNTLGRVITLFDHYPESHQDSGAATRVGGAQISQPRVAQPEWIEPGTFLKFLVNLINLMCVFSTINVSS